jgi:hypothetical protein
MINPAVYGEIVERMEAMLDLKGGYDNHGLRECFRATAREYVAFVEPVVREGDRQVVSGFAQRGGEIFGRDGWEAILGEARRGLGGKAGN